MKSRNNNKNQQAIVDIMKRGKCGKKREKHWMKCVRNNNYKRINR